ncbi:MAG: magnesium transporter [Firmicutes bacterium]|nr:magnesium transporter [Bacillota bacterium]
MAEVHTDLKKTVLTLIAERSFQRLRDLLVTMQPADIAALFSELSEKNLPLVFRLLPKDLAAETFVEMDSDLQHHLIQSFSDTELQAVVNELYVDDAAALIEEMPANVVKRILSQADPETRQQINEILKYPEDSAGSIMTTEFVSLRAHMSVADAIKRIRRQGFDSETINVCYVTDDGRRLIGVVSIRTLILADENDRIEDIMNRYVVSVRTTEDQETVAKMFAKYDLTVLPVVDGEKRLVGIVTVDDALDVLQEETTEDFEKMAAITPTERPYLKTSVLEIWKSRIPWLLVLMISATFTGLIINHFENALKTYVLLTAYIPMLMDTGGNSGSQASITVIRGLSLNELEFRDLFRVVWKEFQVAILAGVTLALFNFAKLMLFDQVSLMVALVICVTLILTVFVAKLTGCIFPMLAQRAGFDPVVMASPFITTIVDALSLLIYFRIATLMLGI